MAESRTREQLVRRTLRTSRVLCFVALVFPALTAVGSIFGVAWLTQGHPMLPVMHPNTAAGLALAAIGRAPDRPGTPVHVSPNVDRRCSCRRSVLLLGLLTLGEYAFGWDVGTRSDLLRMTLATVVPAVPRPILATNVAELRPARSRAVLIQPRLAYSAWSVCCDPRGSQLHRGRDRLHLQCTDVLRTSSLRVDRDGRAHGRVLHSSGRCSPLPTARRRHDDARHERDTQWQHGQADSSGRARRASSRWSDDTARRRWQAGTASIQRARCSCW